jgi:hypothetical protein
MYDECFDRVLVLFEGRMVFSGLTGDAEEFFLEQGWHKKDRQTLVDVFAVLTIKHRGLPYLMHQCSRETNDESGGPTNSR